MSVNVILLDIEGTTTPIDFVHKVLFPFAKSRIEGFVRDNFDSLAKDIEQLKAERSGDLSFAAEFVETSPESIANYLRHLIDVDRKSTPLKSIQGRIWRAGYEADQLKSQIFDDVPQAFEKWKSAGKTIAIYSSGSVLAQKNLFKYTEAGDLTPFISHYFDTNIGGKRETASYERIAAELSFPPDEILFVSDIPQELDTASEAGLETALSVREGNQLVENRGRYKVVELLTDLEA